MNGPVTQIGAVVAIVIMAMFPSPQKLKEALKIQAEPTLSVQSVEASGDAIVVKVPAYSDQTVVVRQPFPLDCTASRDTPANKLDDCAEQLSSYIDETRLHEGRTRAIQVATNSKVEEARAALAEICRVQWAAQQAGTDHMSDSCASLR